MTAILKLSEVSNCQKYAVKIFANNKLMCNNIKSYE